MEAVMIVLILSGAAILIGYGIVAWRKKRRAEIIAKEHAEDQKNPMTAGMAYPVWTRREARNYPSRKGRFESVAPAPTPARQEDSSNALLYGALGYMVGSSGSHHDNSCRPADDFQGSGGLSGGAGASSSWDGGSSDSSSSSSDSSSSSSSDSGSSSSDSGSSSGGGSD